MKLGLVIPDILRKVFVQCETICLAGCCGLKAFDVDARAIHYAFQSLPREEALQQLDALIAQVSSHDGPVSSSEDFYHEWEQASDCVDYLRAWRAEFERALSGRFERTGSPQERLLQAHAIGRFALLQEVKRLTRETHNGDNERSLEIDSAIASLAEDNPLILNEVMWAREKLARRGIEPYVSAKHPPCPHCGKPLRTSKAKQCRFCRRDWH